MNYTRTRFESGGEPLENPVDLTTPVKWGSREGEATWNDLIGYFMIVGSTTYEGLYEYNGTNTQYELVNTQLNTTSEDIYGNKTVYTNIGKISGTLQNTNNLTLEQLKTRINLYNDLSYLELNENITNLDNFWTSRVINHIPNIDTSNVTSMQSTFYYCSNLTSVPNFDTSNVTAMGYMFAYCSNLTSVPNFNTSKVTIMHEMFNNCSNLTSVPNFDTSNVITMESMFKCCSNLTSVPNFNTGKVTSMRATFYNCLNLTSVSNLDTSNVTDMTYMFTYCSNLTSVPNFNTSKVTIMHSMFEQCSNLTSVPNFDTSNVTDITFMLLGCTNLVDIPQFNTSNITSFFKMCQSCNNLSNASIQNIINMCLNSNVTSSNRKHLDTSNGYSPLYRTKFDNTYYQNRWSELTAAGWKY